MEAIRNFIHDIYNVEYEFFKEDEEYQAAKAERNELEENLLAGLTRKQRVLFRQYKSQQETLTTLELRRIFSHCSVLLTPKEKQRTLP